MLVLVPQSLCDSPYGNDKHALKIVSRIVCGHINACRKYRSKQKLKGKPTNPASIYGQWINVDGKIFKAIASDYRPICARLERDGFIERNEKAKYANFVGKSYPYSFRLKPTRWADRLTLHSVPQRRTEITVKRTWSGLWDRYGNEYEAAERHLTSFSLPEGQVTRLDAMCERSTWPDLQRYRIATLYRGKWWSRVDSYGRYHSPFTNIAKGIRNALLCSGKDVVGYDFANFQPALLTLYSRTGIDIEIPLDERDMYFDICQRGSLYEFIAEHSPERPTRKKVKTSFCKMLNMMNEDMKRMTVFPVFDELFPTYSRIVQEIKKHDHRAMTRFLQDIETEVIFGGVVREFVDRSHVPFFTVHDSIYVEKSDEHILKDVLTNQINLFKIPTRVKVENNYTTRSTPTFNHGMNVGSGCPPHQSTRF
jgi:hypothetical protein